MKKLYVVLKIIPGSQCRGLKVYSIEDNTPILIMDDFISLLEVNSFSTEEVDKYILKRLDIISCELVRL